MRVLAHEKLVWAVSIPKSADGAITPSIELDEVGVEVEKVVSFELALRWAGNLGINQDALCSVNPTTKIQEARKNDCTLS
jgi:hypothetical protein